MSYQSCFERYEMKYLLTHAQRDALLECIRPYMALDQYGRTTIRNLYYDTESYRLIRRSIEKPVYKEKLRIRSYQRAGDEDTVLVELKKKFKKIVYKRRIALPQRKALAWLAGDDSCAPEGQIAREITYFRNFYGDLRPTVYLSYEREAFYSLDGSEFRLTLDENILVRQTDLTLNAEPGGLSLLPEGMVMMELKSPGALPLWIVRFLSEHKIYKTSFSKYGTAYERMLYQGGSRRVSGIV